MLGLGWNVVVGAAQRSVVNSGVANSSLVRAAMLPAGAVVGLAFAVLSIAALRRLPQMADPQ